MQAILSACLKAVIAGIIAHTTWFIYGEHHKAAFRYVLIALSAPPVLAYLVHQSDSSWLLTALYTALLLINFTVGLASSILIYRGFLHRLHRFPGPFTWKLSKLVHSQHIVDLDNYKQLDRLHKTYGDYVRVGPSELSITDPQAVDLILGPASKCKKAVWYDTALGPIEILNNIRDRPTHNVRRRVWDKAFTMKLQTQYEHRMVHHAQEFVRQVKSHGDQSLNATDWVMYFAFDVIGDIGYSKSFDMLTSDKPRDIVKLFHDGVLVTGTWTPLPWLPTILLPVFSLFPNDFTRFYHWCDEKLEERKKRAIDGTDIASVLLEQPYEGKSALKVLGDGRLLVIAGGDTSSVSLTYLLYRLVSEPGQVERLRAELDPILDSQSLDKLDAKSIAKCPHLNGVIHESLRLHPVVPSSLMRQTPPEGLQIGSHYISGNVTVGMPSYSLNLDARSYERPLEFIPERWYSQPELIHEPRTFHPFGLGVFGCIGRQVALSEMRIFTALVVHQFDIAFAPGEDGTALQRDQKDAFTMAPGKLMLSFTARKT